MIEHGVLQDPKKPVMTDRALFLGSSQRKAGSNLVGTLAKHVSKKAAEEASILKEQRKAREERALLKKEGKGS